MSEEHHAGLSPLCCCFSVLHQLSSQKSRAGSCTSEPNSRNDPEFEEGVFNMPYHNSKTEVRENVQGNNIWKLSHQIFLGLHRAAPWRQTQSSLQRYFFLFVYYSLITPREKTPRSFGWCVCVFSLLFVLCCLPDGRHPGVGGRHLQQQAGDVQDDEGLLHANHHHQPRHGLHLLGRAQDVNVSRTPRNRPHSNSSHHPSMLLSKENNSSWSFTTINHQPSGASHCTCRLHAHCSSIS